jgi:hypothetical protein
MRGWLGVATTPYPLARQMTRTPIQQDLLTYVLPCLARFQRPPRRGWRPHSHPVPNHHEWKANP